jgi:hypothetical protein
MSRSISAKASVTRAKYGPAEAVAEREVPAEAAEGRREDAARQEPEPGAHVEAHQEQGRRVGPDAEERRVTEGELPAYPPSTFQAVPR